MIDSRQNMVCEGQYKEWLRAILSKGGRKEEQGENVQRKSSEQNIGMQGYEEFRKELKKSEKEDKVKEQEENCMNKDQDLGKENDFKRISWMKDRIKEESVESVRMEKVGGQEGKNTLVGQENNRRKEEVDLEDGFEGKREQYLKGEVMEIDIGNQLERNTRISLKELDQNVI